MSLRERLAPVVALAACLSFGSMFSGCTVVKKDQAVDRTAQACCTQADDQLQHFKGCRIPRRSCRGDERWWMRGYVVCTAVDEAGCDGGRCCEYRPQYDPAVSNAAEPDAAPPAEGREPAAEPADADVDADAPPQADAPDEAAPAEADGDDPEAPLP